MLAEIRVAPRPAGVEGDRYAYVDVAIAVIATSGLPYEVHALGTVVDGPADEVWALLRAVHEAALAAGADAATTTMTVSQGAGDAGPTMAELLAPYRD